MAKPPSSTKSVRLKDSVWAGLSRAAAGSGLTVNKLIAEAVDRFDADPPPIPKRSTPAPPIEETMKRLAQDLAKPNALVARAFGPQRPAYGARLKVKK